MRLDTKIPAGPLQDKWDRHRLELGLIAPGQRRRFEIIVVGTGLAGASASAALAEQGYKVKTFCLPESPRRANSIAAQGGIDAARDYTNEGDSVSRLFQDVIEAGEFRSREADVYRLAQISNNVIDQCVAQGVPLERDYAGHLSTRSGGGAEVSRTFYARDRTGQQLLLAAYGALSRQVESGNVKLFTRREMLDLVVIGGKARGIIVRNLLTGQYERYAGHAVILCTGGYSNIFFLSTNAMSSSVTAAFRAYKRGAGFANPCFTQFHPTCIPVTGDYQSKLIMISDSLCHDGRVWVSKRAHDLRGPEQIPEEERDYYLERKYRGVGSLVPHDVASRNAKEQVENGKGVGPGGAAVYLDFSEAIKRQGREAIMKRHGRVFELYQKITGEDPVETPMMVYPAPHYSIGGLWVDYNMMSTIPGLFVLGEANFAEHGANRLPAAGLMQGLADGYFIIPRTVAGYFAGESISGVDTDHRAFDEAEQAVSKRIERLLKAQGRRTPLDFHRRLGLVMYDYCGMTRNNEGLNMALQVLPGLREEFREDLKVRGAGDELNHSLERAGRVEDFMEFAELMLRDALVRQESCGCHFNEDFQTAAGEPLRDDENFSHVAVWEYRGEKREPELHKEPLVFEEIKPTPRSYK